MSLGLIDEQRVGEWIVATFDDTEPANQSETVLAALVATSQSPAIVAGILDSDTVEVSGLGPSTGNWTTCIAPQAMIAFCVENGRDYADYYLPPELAASAAIAWAHEGGLPCDPAAVHEILRTREADVFVEPLLMDFLTALGIGRVHIDSE